MPACVPGVRATSWFGFARAVLDQAIKSGVVQHKPKVYPISRAEYHPPAAARPKNSRLVGDRACQRFSVALPDWNRASKHRIVGAVFLECM
jgi:dTDP-4-dehydrorhamnose reductase